MTDQTPRRAAIRPVQPQTFEAVLWDGTPEAWVAIGDLPWDECWVEEGEPGVVWRHRIPSTIPLNSWVYATDAGPLEWLPPDEVQVLGGDDQ